MADPVKISLANGVARVAFVGAAAAGLDGVARRSIFAAIALLSGDARIVRIVLVSEGASWPSGVDHESGEEAEIEPTLSTLCTRIAESPKPVIALVHGAVLGPGLELALAARHRVASPETLFGFPEIGLGITPSGGGTQRLPRLIGARAALNLFISGQLLDANAAMQIGLIDQIAGGDRSEAMAWLAADLVADAGAGALRPAPPGGPSDPPAYLAAVADMRAALKGPGNAAALRIVECVEAALLLPPAVALEFEHKAREDLEITAEATALRHAFLAERRAVTAAAADLEPGGGRARKVERVGVVGAGLMGAGITSALLGAGYDVVLIEKDEAALATGLSRVATIQDWDVSKGRLSTGERDAQWARLTGAANPVALARCDLVIEAVPEDPSMKTKVFSELARIVPAGAILASNTSYLDIASLATASGRGGDVLGLHFFAPAHRTRVLELVATDATAPEVIGAGFDLARRLGKIVVRSGDSEGFIGNRLLVAYRTAADFMLEDGATPYQIDAAMRAFGFELGPYESTDRIGLEIGRDRRKRGAKRRDLTRRHVTIADDMCALGWTGRRAGRGFYIYPPGVRTGQEDPEVLALIAAVRKAKGIAPRGFGADEIRERCLAAMANEGVRLLAEGVARHPDDIDLVMMLGCGFPRHRGGPMQVADQEGLLSMRNRLRVYARTADKWFWQPPELWSELIKNGRKFGDADIVWPEVLAQARGLLNAG